MNCMNLTRSIKMKNNKNIIRIGTRGSALALWQAEYIRQLLLKLTSIQEAEIVKIATEGDRDQASSLTVIGGQGVFTKAIEEALLKNEVDMAVHSLKDLPSSLDDRLQLAAVPQRASAADVLITLDGRDLNTLPLKATLGSGSLRRRSQLLHKRNDLILRDLRGNIDTRLTKLRSGMFDGIIMAEAALQRLQITGVSYHKFSPDEMVPAVGQGAIGVEIRKADEEIFKCVTPVNDFNSFSAVRAERAFLQRLDSGCQFPVGAYAVCEGDRLAITGFAASEDGETLIKAHLTGSMSDPETCGIQLAEYLITKGAKALLDK